MRCLDSPPKASENDICTKDGVFEMASSHSQLTNIQRCTMAFILMGIAYVLLLAFLVRFFQAVHRWDEEICSMEIRGSVRAGRVPKQEAA